MTKMSPHTRWRGCPLCKPYKMRGQRASREPFAVLRQIGQRRRLTRPSRENW